MKKKIFSKCATLPNKQKKYLKILKGNNKVTKIVCCKLKGINLMHNKHKGAISLKNPKLKTRLCLLHEKDWVKAFY